MKSLIDLLHKDKEHWLTVPRFAVMVLPLGLAGVLSSAGYGAIAVVLLVITALGMSRLIWFRLLPHETVRLTAARQALAAAHSDEAVRILQAPLQFSGVHYKLQRAALLSKAYLREGMFIEAHGVLSTVNEKALLASELMRLSCAWAQLFHAAGNHDEAARRLEGISLNDFVDDAECLLIKAWIGLEQGNLIEARQLLEVGLDRNPKDDLRMLLLNNLAAVECLQGRTDTQLRHLQAALTIFRNSPRPDLTSILHHNLAIALARAGRSGEARGVLREAWAGGDRANLGHVLEVLNNSLHAAREVGDENWKREAYEEFDRQLSRFDSLLPREQLALDVSQLRMRRNDGMPLEPGVYLSLIKRLLDNLDAPKMTIPDGDRVSALVEIALDLKCAMQTQCLPSDVSTLYDLMRSASLQLLDKRTIVDAYLNTLSPKLTGPLNAWHGYQTSIDKAEIFLAQSNEVRFSCLDKLFRHLRERAERLTEQDAPYHAIKAWVILCDEYLAYHDQLEAHEKLDCRKRYLHLAEHALDRVVELIEASKNQQSHIDYFIGAAWFALRLRNDVTTAARYMTIVKKINPAPEHFAIWLRDQYQWVLERVNSHLENQTPPT